MQNKNIKETVSAEVTTPVEKIYVVKEPSFFGGLYYNSGEVIRTSKEPSIHMKEVTEEELGFYMLGMKDQTKEELEEAYNAK